MLIHLGESIHFGVFLLILSLLFIPLFTVTKLKAQSSNHDFELKLIGYTGEKRFGGAPTPPGYNATSLGTITWDYAWYFNLVFQLEYNGKDPIKISSIQIWQETQWEDVTWNVTDPINIPPPSKTIYSGGIFEFQVNESFIGENGGADIIYAAIQVESQDLVLLSLTVSFPKFLSTWDSQTTLYYPSTFTASILILCVGILGLTIYRKRIKSS